MYWARRGLFKLYRRGIRLFCWRALRNVIQFRASDCTWRPCPRRVFLTTRRRRRCGRTNVRLALVLSTGATKGLFSFRLRYRLSVLRSPPSAAPTAQVAAIGHAALSVPLDGRLKGSQHQRKFPRGWGHDTLMLCSLHYVGSEGRLCCAKGDRTCATRHKRGATWPLYVVTRRAPNKVLMRGC